MSWSFSFDDFDIGSTSSASSPKRASNACQPSGMFDQDSSSGTMTLSELIPGVYSAKITGIVIAKEEPRHFPSKKDPSSERYLFNFTIRDSPNDFVNITCWGGEEYITEVSQQFHITDIVEVSRVTIQSKPSDGSEERFRPWTPSACSLSMSENKSSIKIVTEWFMAEMSHLLHIPTKPNNDYYSISDVVTNGQSLAGEYINVLAVVKQIGTTKEITTKLGKKMTRCEVKLFDETDVNLDLIIWDKEMIHFAETWLPKEHVLFAADVRVSYNDFKKCMIITATSKTVVTVNPDTREAHKLYQYAQTANIEDEQQMDVTFQDVASVDLNSIHDIYTIEEIKAKHLFNPGSNNIVYGITFAYITTMDIDADSFSIVTVRCTRCNFKVNPNTGMCSNLSCSEGCLRDLDSITTDTHVAYDLRLSISDHTGTLSCCRVVSEAVNKMLNCPPEAFQNLSVDQRTSLKWTFLLERCKIIFKILPATYEIPQSSLRIIACEKSDPNEVIGHNTMQHGCYKK